MRETWNRNYRLAGIGNRETTGLKVVKLRDGNGMKRWNYISRNCINAAGIINRNYLNTAMELWNGGVTKFEDVR